MFDDPEGPIEHFEWAVFIINGQRHSAAGEGVGKDIFLFEERVAAWDARQGHRLKPQMVSCLSGISIAVLVIGIGVNGAIRVPEKTKQTIRDMGIDELIVAKTPEACRAYNRFVREGCRVALLAHGTC